MDRRQADKIRDLQRGQFLGLGPAVSRRPVAQKAPRPVIAHRPATEIEQELAVAPTSLPPLPQEGLVQEKSDEPQFSDDSEPDDSTQSEAISSPEQALTDCDGEAQTAPPNVESLIRNLASGEGATFLSATALFRDFAVLCRQSGVASAHIDITAFRRLFAYEIAGFNRLPSSAKSAVEERIAGVDEDVLAPYLAMLVATALGEPMPDEDGLALLYGSSSPSRVRRMLDHLERQGLIVIREEFGGDRTIYYP